MLFYASPTDLLKMHFNLIATTKTAGSAALFVTLMVIGLLVLAFFIFVIISYFKVFEKAGRKSWYAIIPVYSAWVIYEIGGYPGWWALLMLIPFVSFVALVVYAMAMIRMAKRFDKGAWFGFFGLFLFPYIGWPILAFGKAQYNNPAEPIVPQANPSTPPMPPAPINNLPMNPPIAPDNVVPTAPTVVNNIVPTAPTTDNIIPISPAVVGSAMPPTPISPNNAAPTVPPVVNNTVPTAPTTDNIIPTPPVSNNTTEVPPANKIYPDYPQ
jgi:uncharacterized membrane protein YhaH (DUF805 family)